MHLLAYNGPWLYLFKVVYLDLTKCWEFDLCYLLSDVQ